MSYINNHNFSKSVRYIFDNIDQPLELIDIAAFVGVSLSTLKRLFVDVTGKSPGTFIRHMRMEHAFRTLKSKNESILEVALAAGFDDPSAFTRCFKEIFGYPPKEARKRLNIVNELDCIELSEPEIIELIDIPIQAITLTGLYFESAPKAWHQLKEKLSPYELSEHFSGYFIGIGHDNPHDGTVAEDRVRYSACIAQTNRNLEIENRKISGGNYARFHYKGKPVNLGLAYHYIYGRWMEGSETKINPNIPAFVGYDAFPDGITEQRLIIHVPLLMF